MQAFLLSAGALPYHNIRHFWNFALNRLNRLTSRENRSDPPRTHTIFSANRKKAKFQERARW